MPINNPAGRLLEFVKEAQKIPGDWGSRQGWARLLGVQPNDTASLLRHICPVIELPSLIKEKMTRLENISHDIYLEWVPRIESHLNQVELSSPWHKFLSGFDQTFKTKLEICDDLLSHNSPEPSLDKQQVQEIQSDVEDLIKDIEASSLDEDLKKYILYYLRKIDDGILEYRIKGIESLKKAFEETYGPLRIDPEAERIKKHPEFLKRFGEILEKINKYISMADPGFRLLVRVIPLLLGTDVPNGATIDCPPDFSNSEHYERSSDQKDNGGIIV